MKDRCGRIHVGAVKLVLALFVTLFPCASFAQPNVYTDRDVYYPGEPVRVYYSGAPGRSGDWICIVASDARDDEPGDFQYIPEGSHRGSMFFTAPPSGDYEVRAYYNYRYRGYVVSSRFGFSVSGEYRSHTRPKLKNAPSRRQKTRTVYSELVKKAQHLLIAYGYYQGPPDGIAGGETIEAIRNYQQDHGLPVTGDLDASTRDKMGL